MIENIDLILKIGITMSAIAFVLSGMFLIQLINEKETRSFFEIWFYSFMVLTQLLLLLFYNSYKNKIDLKIPLWIFRISLIAMILMMIFRKKMA